MFSRVVTVGTLLLAAVLVVFVVSVAAAAPAGYGGPSDSSTPLAEGVTASPVPATSAEEIDPDSIEIDVVLAEDGSAEWEIQFRVALDDEDREAAFAELEENVSNDPETYTERFADRIDSTVENAAAATGRPMHADGYAVRTDRQSLAREYGILAYSFRWHGFAAVDGDELHAGDAIDRYYLDTDTRMALSWPAEYELVSVAPDPNEERERTLVWRGSETDFVSGEPRIVVSSGGSFPSATAAFAGLVAIGLVTIGAAWWYRRRFGTADSPRGGSGSPSGPAADEGTDPSSSGSGTDGAEPSQPAPEEFLSNEERVLGLLEERGGRMKQQQVVQELGWTDAKTSQVVSNLRADGELESFRLGRENVLVLPDAERAPDEIDL